MNPAEDEHPSPSLLLQTAALLPILVVFLGLLEVFYLDRFGDRLNEFGISYEIPSIPAHTRILSPDTLHIDIHADGTVSIAGILSEPSNSSDLSLLRQHLRSVRDAVNKHGGLVVRPDSKVRFQRLIDVLSAVTGSGIMSYGLT